MRSIISVLTALGPDRTDHLAEAAASVLGQDLPEGWALEWLICMDGSSSTLELPEDDRIRVLATGRPGGPGMCRNVAAAQARGDVYRNFDADDVLLPGALAADIAALASDGVVWTTSEALDLLPDGSTESFARRSTDRAIDVGAAAEQWRRSPILDFHVTTLAVRADAFWKFGGYAALPTGEDVSMVVRLNLVHPGVHRIAPTLLYRKWPGQLTAEPRSDTNIGVRRAMVGALTEPG